MRKFIYTGTQVVTKDDGKADVVRDLKQQQRAFGLLEIKEFDEKTRRFKGIATTIAPDHMDDVVEPSGAEFKLPVPFLYQHDSKKPIGWIDKAKIGKTQIDVEGYVEIPDADAPETIVERLNTAWYELKKRMVRGLSIGFNPKEWSFIKETGGIRWLRWAWLELSMVTIAANAEASITSIKSAYAKSMAASGRSTTPPTGSSTTARAGAPNLKGSNMKTIQEQLAELNELRQTKHARMSELGDLKRNESRAFTDDERKEFDALEADIDNIDDDIRIAKRHSDNIATARPVTDSKSGARGAPYGFVKKLSDVEDKFKGETGLKRAMCHVLSMSEVKQGRFVTPDQIAAKMYGKTNPTLVTVMKAGVAGGGTDSGEWGAELAQVDNRYTGDFIEFLYGLTVFDRLPLRSVPHNVAIKGQDGAFTGYFIGQSKAIKVSAGDFSTASTTPYKAAGLCVVSNEWLRDASGDGLQLCGQGLREAVAQAVDSLFLSATAAASGVAPAGILNGVSAILSNGDDALSVATDIKALFAPFITAKNLSGGLAWVMSPTTAVALSLMKNALGQAEYPAIGPNGGTFMGYPVVIGDNVASGDVILLKPSDIWKIGDLGVSLSVSDSAMIEQDSAPTGATDTPVAATANMVSMFQEDSTAIKVVRPISWGKRRATAVQYVGDAAWGSSLS